MSPIIPNSHYYRVGGPPRPLLLLSKHEALGRTAPFPALALGAPGAGGGDAGRAPGATGGGFGFRA